MMKLQNTQKISSQVEIEIKIAKIKIQLHRIFGPIMDFVVHSRDDFLFHQRILNWTSNVHMCTKAFEEPLFKAAEIFQLKVKIFQKVNKVTLPKKEHNIVQTVDPTLQTLF